MAKITEFKTLEDEIQAAKESYLSAEKTVEAYEKKLKAANDILEARTKHYQALCQQRNLVRQMDELCDMVDKLIK